MKEKDIKQRVLDKITKGEVVMRPKIYFVAQVVLIASLASLAFILSIYATSFAFFSIHESGEQFLLGFGSQGIYVFFALFPWWIVLVILALVVLVEYLVRRFRFAYHSSLFRIFGILFVCAILLGIVIDFTPFHTFLLDRADRGELPLFGSIYESIRVPHRDQGVFRGVVDSISLQNNSFVISHDDFDNDSDDGTYTVIAPTGFDMGSLQVGDKIYVAGTSSRGIIYSYGINLFDR